MDSFIAQYEKQIIGHLTGFDRLVLRGTLRALAIKSGMMSFLWNTGVQLKDCGKMFLDKSKQLKEASCAQAHRENRPVSICPLPRPIRSRRPLKLFSMMGSATD